jgi:ABC-type bacteriocin/lantibiotic exporter with double-glycine peptidase domain
MHLILKPVKSKGWIKNFWNMVGKRGRNIAGVIFISIFTKICQILGTIFIPVVKL